MQHAIENLSSSITRFFFDIFHDNHDQFFERYDIEKTIESNDCFCVKINFVFVFYLIFDFHRFVNDFLTVVMKYESIELRHSLRNNLVYIAHYRFVIKRAFNDVFI